ncbi:MAG: FkbM family methyltransferase [Rhodobacteraceae bacterium]|nr:FkbM family methyltransferase [Paracoccaceae bacterium]
MKKLINYILGFTGFRITKKSNLENLLAQNYSYVQELELLRNDFALLRAVASEARSDCLDFMHKSKSQIRQDLFVLSELGFKKNGYFVEFGATNGVDISNSYLMEKEFQWNGVLAEPAQMWHRELRQNRSVSIETKCVWKESGQTVKFNETEIGDLSTIDSFSEKDLHSEARKSGTRYDVETISLIDLLETHNAPKVIDYLSIDTEGSEYEILRNFDFDRYQFKVITCEHNNTPQREKIYDLLTRNGYMRKFEALSKYDDWYVSEFS